jgi:hypothetical protein
MYKTMNFFISLSLGLDTPIPLLSGRRPNSRRFHSSSTPRSNASYVVTNGQLVARLAINGVTGAAEKNGNLRLQFGDLRKVALSSSLGGVMGLAEDWLKLAETAGKLGTSL